MKNAGRDAGLSRHFFLPTLLCLTTLLAHPVICLAQEMETIQSEDELTAALTKVGNDPHSLRALLEGHQSLVSSRLWEKLIARAASAYYFKGPGQSLALYSIALAVAGRLNDVRRLASTHYSICRTYSGLGRANDAIRSCLESRKLFESVGARRDMVYVLSDLGSLYLYARDYRQAKSYSEEAILMADAVKNANEPPGALPDQYGAATALSTLGALCGQDGNYAQAIEHLQHSLALFRESDGSGLKYGYQQADDLAELGRVYKAMGNNAQALLFLNKALDTAGKLPYPALRAGILNSIGVLYLEQEDYAKAFDYFEQSLETYKKSSNPTEAALVLQNLGVTYLRQGSYDRAIESFQKSIRLAGDTDQDVLIAADQGLGAVYREKGEFKSSLDVLDRSLLLAEKVGDQTRVAEILWRKAETCYDLQNYVDAVALSDRALKIARQLQLPKLSYLAATTLGRAYAKQKQPDLALATLTQAIEQVEMMRPQVAGREQERQLFFEKKVVAYHSMIDLLVERGKLIEALTYAEKAKGRVLLDILSGGRFQLSKVLTPKEREEEQRLSRTVTELNTEIREDRLKINHDLVRLEQLSGKLSSARLKYAAFHDLLYATHPEWRTPYGQATPQSLEELNSLIPDQNTALLEFVATKEKVYLFLLKRKPDRNLDLTVYTVNVKEEDLKKMVDRYRQMLADRHPDFDALSIELYHLLIKPAAQQLQGVSTIGIIADGVLWELPFQALQTREGHNLVEDFSMFYAPSLSVLKEIERRRRANPRAPSLLAFANPVAGTETPAPQESRTGGNFSSLIDAENEVRSLAGFFEPGRSKIFIGASADEKTFESLAPAYSVIHCATHGVLDNNQPLYSYLLFSKAEGNEDDGLLEAREVLNLDLNADMVVLSACETARGRIGAGEGMIGMSWAFLAAGSRATVVSQWKVNSAATAEWMHAFYQQLQQMTDGKRIAKAEALRAAMLGMMKDRRFNHPFYWAGFILIGSND